MGMLLMFDGLMGRLTSSTKEGAVNMLLNAKPVLRLLNERVQAYGSITEIHYERERYEIRFQMLGLADLISVSMRDFELSDDDRRVRLLGLDSDVEGVRNLLRDFLEGREISVPERVAAVLDKIRKVL